MTTPKLVPVPSKNMVPERDVDKPPVLECINLGIGQTEIAGLIGPNGAGKTTVFNLLTKVYQPTTGSILLNGQDIQSMDTAWEMMVARAAPCTPMFSPKIKMGSRMMFSTAPISTVAMLTPEKPCALIKAFRPRVNCTNRVPAV